VVPTHLPHRVRVFDSIIPTMVNEADVKWLSNGFCPDEEDPDSDVEEVAPPPVVVTRRVQPRMIYRPRNSTQAYVDV
jgi:hypothetical protein